MDKPLTKWYCDVCGGAIEDVKKGYVIWKVTEDMKSHSFKIIHQSKCDLKDHIASAALEDFLGSEGLAYLTSKWSIGPIKKELGQGSHCSISDHDEFVDFLRRVQIPFYEEARQCFHKRDFLDDNYDNTEVVPYFPKELEKSIKKYGTD